ncbi:hypothetical protein L1987_05542 [Smallanthus sonchifolius]|uniref:Uncharacterized protein n=1 Tax=Smallanthus sonchifolius TaxID=185202 RepID=A0ACB9JVP3_9ASTR|nr:hypothetical protein L1987_05542 [Smallanthus sonchifolius]
MSLVNNLKGRAYSHRYYDILEKGKTLPVSHEKEEFLKHSENKTLILVGQTGCGKVIQLKSRNYKTRNSKLQNTIA